MLIQIEGGGQLLQVNDVGYIGFEKAEDGERTGGGYVPTCVDGQYLDPHIRPLSKFGEVPQLTAHDFHTTG